MTGVDRIAAERRRQQEAEGFTPDRDDGYLNGELIAAAVAYAMVADPDGAGDCAADFWPWAEEWWKPSPEPFRNLERAGALIAAELDRRERALGLPMPAAEGAWRDARKDVCQLCGSVVGDTDRHDAWHADLTAFARAASRGDRGRRSRADGFVRPRPDSVPDTGPPVPSPALSPLPPPPPSRPNPGRV